MELFKQAFILSTKQRHGNMKKEAKSSNCWLNMKVQNIYMQHLICIVIILVLTIVKETIYKTNKKIICITAPICITKNHPSSKEMTTSLVSSVLVGSAFSCVRPYSRGDSARDPKSPDTNGPLKGQHYCAITCP